VPEQVKDTTQLHCGEAFGPLVEVEPYKHFADAVELNQLSRYGLQTGVFTSDINKSAFRLARTWRSAG